MATGKAQDWARTCSGSGVVAALRRWALIEPQLAFLGVFVGSGSRSGAVHLRVTNRLARQRVKRRCWRRCLATDSTPIRRCPPSSTYRAEVVQLARTAIAGGRITSQVAEVIVLTRLCGLCADAAATTVGIHAAPLRRARNRAEAARWGVPADDPGPFGSAPRAEQKRPAASVEQTPSRASRPQGRALRPKLLAATRHSDHDFELGIDL